MVDGLHDAARSAAGERYATGDVSPAARRGRCPVVLRRIARGGPTVTTILANPNTRPGRNLQGEIRADGGDAPWDVPITEPITEADGQHIRPMSLNLSTQWSSGYPPRLSCPSVIPR